MNTNLINLEKRTFGRQRSWPLIVVLMALASSFSLALSVGDRITATSNVKVRTAPPTLGDTGSTQTFGATGTVVAGATYGTAGGYSGNWYSINWDSGTDGWSAEPYLAKLSSVVVPTVQTSGVSGVGSATATLNATITNDGGGAITDARFEYTSGSFPGIVIYSIPVSGSSFSYNLSGLQPGTTYTYHAYAKNSAGWNSGVNNVTFTTSGAVQVPSIQAGSASSVGNTAATLNATITNNGGSAVTDARFEYTSSGFPGTVIYSVPVSGNSFSYSLSSLQPGTTYTFHAFAKNSAGWSAASNNVTFTTGAATVLVPTVQATAATAVGQTSATLNASISSTGGAAVTDARFEYTSSSFPGSVIYSVPVLGNSFSYSLSGLQPGTTYTYHAYAKNSAGWNSIVNNEADPEIRARG